MGANYSGITDLNSNQELLRFAGETSLTVNDPFWTSFLSFHLQLPFATSQSKLLEESCSIYLQLLEANNPKTNNYGILIEIFIRYANLARDQPNDVILMRQTYNTLLILRVITKYFIEIDSEQNLCPYFIPQESSLQRISLMCIFIDSLYRLAIIVPVELHSYGLHLEVLNTLLAFLSIQMCADEAILISAIYSIFMHRLDPLLVSEFARTLLEHFVRQAECPPTFAENSNATSNEDVGTLVKIGKTVASSFWSVMTLGMASGSQPNNTDMKTTNPIESAKDLRHRHLSNQSIHLLLILSNHFTHDMHHNPYRLALLHFTDTHATPTNIPDSEPLPWFSVDYHCLYDVLCQTIHTDQSTLLLYLLIHRNQHFRAFVISRTNIDQLVLPILQVVHRSNERNSHHVYMLLIILLILSEDEYFNRTVHQIKLNNIHWYEERASAGLNLGGLLISIVLRAIQFSMTRMKDKYLHTNCLAALANMSSNFEYLHPFVTQRIVALFNLFSKKYSKLIDQIQQRSMSDEMELPSVDEFLNDLSQDLSQIEDVMRMLLEIIDSCLIHKLQQNVNLIYALLYDRDVFDNYRENSNFQDVLQNIETVIDFFSEKIDQLEQRSAGYVKEILEINAKIFPLDRLKKSPDLKFKYIEEEQPEDFFVPYVWALVYKSCHLYWSSEPSLISKQKQMI